MLIGRGFQEQGQGGGAYFPDFTVLKKDINMDSWPLHMPLSQAYTTNWWTPVHAIPFQMRTPDLPFVM